MPTTVIGCDILREELEWVLSRHPELSVEPIWLKAGLHNDLDLDSRKDLPYRNQRD